MPSLAIRAGSVCRFDDLVDQWVCVEVCGEGGGAEAPKPSDEEKALQATQNQVAQQQLEISKQQLAYSQAVTPMQLAQGGYTLTEAPRTVVPATGGAQYIQGVIGQDGAGNPIYGNVPNPDYHPAGFTYDTANLQAGEYAIPIGDKTYIAKLDPNIKKLQDLNTQVSTASAQRQLNALQGNLPVDPAVEQDLTRGEQQLRAELAQRLGPGYETSDPGIRALNEFQRQANSIRFQVRYGEMTNAGAMGANAQNELQREQSQLMGTLAAGQNPYQITAGLLGQSAETANQAYGQSQSERFGAFNLGMQSQSANNQLIGAGIGAGATVAIGGAILI